MTRRNEISGNVRWVILALIGLVVVTVWATTRADNAVYKVPELYERGAPSNNVIIRNDSLIADAVAVSLFDIVKILDKIVVDTIYGNGTIINIESDTTFFDSDSSSAHVVLWFGAHGGGIKWDRTTDSLYWSINGGSLWVAFGTGGTAGSTNADSLRGIPVVATTPDDGDALLYDSDGDSLYYGAVSGTDTDQDSTFVVHYSSRWAPLPDSNVLYYGNLEDSAIFLIDRDNDLLVVYTNTYKFDHTVTDSQYVTRGEAVGLISGGSSDADSIKGIPVVSTTPDDGDAMLYDSDGDSLYFGAVASGTGDIEGVTAGKGLTGGGTTGSVTLYLDTAWLYSKIDTTTAKIPTATLADSAVKYDTANVVNWTELRTEIKNGAEIYNKIDTTAAKIPTATLSDSTTGGAARATSSAIADSAVKGDTSITVQWAEMRTEIKNGAEIYNRIDTTAAKIPTATLSDSTAGGAARATRAAVADSAVKSDTSVIVDWTELRTEIKNRAEIYNKIDTTTAKIPTATLSDSTAGGSARATRAAVADSAVKGDTSITVQWDELRTEIKNGAEIYNKIDTTAAKIPTATLADSSVKQDTANTLNWTEVRTEIKNGAEIYNKIDTTTAKIPTASLADSTSGGAARAETAKSVIANSIDSTEIIDEGIGSGDIGTGRITTTHILNQTIGQADVDSGAGISVGRLYANQTVFVDTVKPYTANASINIGESLCVAISPSQIGLLSDFNDDSLVVEMYPEFAGGVLVPGWSTVDIAYRDSIKIYGTSDSVGMHNALVFHDSTLTEGKHRRHFQIEIPVPDRVDSLRHVIVWCRSYAYTSESNEFFLRAKLQTRPALWSNIDSLSGGTILDVDSSAAASLTAITLADNWAVTPFTSRWLVLTARRDVGNTFQYAMVEKIRVVWSRTRL